MERTPKSNNTSILKFKYNVSHIFHLFHEKFILPSTRNKSMTSLESSLTRVNTLSRTICPNSCIFILRHIEMPHQTNNTTSISPFSNRSNIIIINPSIRALIRYSYMNKIIAIDSRIFTCKHMYFIGLIMIPSYMSHHTR